MQQPARGGRLPLTRQANDHDACTEFETPVMRINRLTIEIRSACPDYFRKAFEYPGSRIVTPGQPRLDTARIGLKCDPLRNPCLEVNACPQ